ncbi:MAG: flagellar basal body P-ring formation chaperone FlgA [Planctomycetaceae bacterium]|jgi:flagella basal body P-ring formation protein FlgA|nr:flagellar basal body P-ring formation chaperone FlgA [Planctomycetaceae bacterium]
MKLFRLFIFCCLIFCETLSFAATVTFRGDPVICQSTAVTLGDVAAITPDADDDAESLASLKEIVLFPAPVAGKDRTTTYREIYDFLRLQGVPVERHAFAGASRVTVMAGNRRLPQTQSAQHPAPNINAETNKNKQTNSDVNSHAANQSNFAESTNEEKMVEFAVLTFLQQNVSRDAPWQVRITFTPEKEMQIASGGGIVGIRAVTDDPKKKSVSTSPTDSNEKWLGKQWFELQCQNRNATTGLHSTMFAEAYVSLPPQIVVMRHAVPKGKILTIADVKLDYVTESKLPQYVTRDRTVNGVTVKLNGETEIDPNIAVRLEDVLGKAALRPLREGTPITLSQLEQPVLVKRSDVVTMYVRNNGIEIKMLGRAKQDGRSGEWIPVEALNDKQQTNLGMVVAQGTVEIDLQGKN